MKKSTPHSTFPLLFLLSVLALGLTSSTITRSDSSQQPRNRVEVVPGDEPAAVPGGPDTLHEMGWEEVDRLQSEDKFAAAAEAVDRILAAAIADQNQEEWARALVRSVQLRTALHGYETAVRIFQETPWPDDPVARTVVKLFYSHGLITYLRVYSWEIAQRERVETEDEVDLRRWTRDQIVEKSSQALYEIWQDREAWGQVGIGPLSEYLQQNNYPARIRGTLRDAVSYLWVELLADSSLWSARQSNQSHRLDRATLTERGAAAALADRLGESDLHPLLAMTIILDDLEIWHLESERPEAALQARIERLERLHGALDQEEDRERFRESLDKAIDELGRRYGWWSMGRASLAEMVRVESAPDALIRAHAIARAGMEAHPDSPGGERCRHIVAAIEAPHFDLTSMKTDGVDRRSILIRHKNLSALHFRAYRIDLLEQIESSQDYHLLPGYREVPEIVRSRLPVAEWSVELPPTRDYRIHQTYAVPGIPESGLYVIVASARRNFAVRHNRLVAVNIVIGDLVLLTRNSGQGFEVEVRSGASGAAVTGAEVLLYRFDYRRGHRRVATQRTDDGGRALFKGPGRQQDRYFLVARLGSDIGLETTALWRVQAPVAGTRSAAMIYTDRSVYRPLQQIQWKVVAYQLRADGNGAVQPGQEIEVELLDANHQVVESARTETNTFGSAAGGFEVPAGRLLGQWYLRTSLGGRVPVRVEEYKRPTFEIEIAEPEEALRLNRQAVLSGTARYYFGLPVVAGDLRWRVERVPVFPRWWWHWDPPRVEPQIVAAGGTETDADGRFEMSFFPAADERLAGTSGLSYNFALRVELVDDGGETRTAERIFRLGFVAVQASIESDREFFLAAEPVCFEVRRSDLDGVPRPGGGTWTLERLEQPTQVQLPADQPLPEPDAEAAVFSTPGDRLRPRWENGAQPSRLLRLWRSGVEIATDSVEHGDGGLATIEIGGLAVGAYRLRYSTQDRYGQTYETQHEFVVAADGAEPVALPFLVAVERSALSVGDRARLLIQSGLEDQELVLEIYHRGQRSRRRILNSNQGSAIIDIPIGAEDRGGFGVRVTAVRDHQVMTATQTVFVPWQDRELEVAFASFRDLLRPGSKETWRVEVKGWQGEALGAGAAEVLAYMYDRSLDIFAPHQPPDVRAIYPSYLGVGPLEVNLGTGGEIWSDSSGFGSLPGYPHFSGDRLIFFDGYGIGGPGRRYRMAVPQAAKMELREDMAMSVAAESGLAGDVGAAEEEAGGSDPDAAEGLRADFSETAFWKPHLLLDADGTVAFEFVVPDSVTEWNVWAHAVTRDLRGGSVHMASRSVKDLMVRPYLPRFLREGDRAELRIVINNASEEEMTGTLDLEIRDPDSETGLLAEFGVEVSTARKVPFAVAAGGSTSLTFELQTPPRVGQVAIEVAARAGSWRDGEVRPLPILPGRMHLSQSRFAALRDADRRELSFPDLAAADDPTRIHEQLVVTLDAQLFYGVLQALPYLVRFPYECTEQTLNRFLSTGIVTSLYDDYPQVARMAKEFSRRETRLETWDAVDPNRKMELVETPWLQEARGGGGENPLINVLDPRIARAEKRAALAKLAKSQTSLGGFPWWSGGPPSPYMTLYLLQGFSRALEFGIEIPREPVLRAWQYMHRHFIDELVQRMVDHDCCWETITFLNFVLSSYPDDSWTGGVFTAEDRQQMLEFSFRHWRRHSPLLKSYLALTLTRSGRTEDGRLVFSSVMDSAKTTRDEGTFWAPEERAWLWYNDTIETHAFALRTLTEIDPDDERRHGLVHWLFLNKKLNHWKSTRATAEVVYSLTHYLDHEGGLGQREAATVAIGDRRREFEWHPDRYSGKNNQWVVSGEDIDSETDSRIVVEKSTPGLLFASATWHFSTEKMPTEARGDFFSVERSFFRRVSTAEGWVLQPLAGGDRLAVGDQIEVQLSLRTRHAAEFVHLRDPRGAGFEPVAVTSGYKWNLGIGWYEEIRDSGTNFFFDWLPVGEYTFKYRLRVAMDGTFKVAPAVLQSMYAPEFTAYSAGTEINVGK